MSLPTSKTKPWHVVVALGLLTTAVTLFGVWWLDANSDDFHIMGWYANYVIPAGAIIVGVAASSGYGVGSWVTGLKISKHLLWAVVALQLSAYFAAQYIEFDAAEFAYDDGTPVGFFEYFDFAARSFAWKQTDGTSGVPLGIWGYAFRVLEIVGFVLGGLIVPLGLRSKAYCEECQIYMKSTAVGLLPAGTPPEKIKKKDIERQAAHAALREEAWTKGLALLAEVGRLAEGGRVADLRAIFEIHPSGDKACAKLDQRIALHLVACKSCENGWIGATVWSGHGNQTRQTAAGTFRLPSGSVAELLGAGRR